MRLLTTKKNCANTGYSDRDLDGISTAARTKNGTMRIWVGREIHLNKAALVHIY